MYSFIVFGGWEEKNFTLLRPKCMFIKKKVKKKAKTIYLKSCQFNVCSHLPCLVYCAEYQPTIQGRLQQTYIVPSPRFASLLKIIRSFLQQSNEIQLHITCGTSNRPIKSRQPYVVCWPIYPILLMAGYHFSFFLFSHSHCEEFLWLGVSHCSCSVGILHEFMQEGSYSKCRGSVGNLR